MKETLEDAKIRAVLECNPALCKLIVRYPDTPEGRAALKLAYRLCMAETVTDLAEIAEDFRVTVQDINGTTYGLTQEDQAYVAALFGEKQ